LRMLTREQVNDPSQEARLNRRRSGYLLLVQISDGRRLGRATGKQTAKNCAKINNRIRHALEERVRRMVKVNAGRSLQDLTDDIPDLVEYFFNDTLAPHYKARKRRVHSAGVRQLARRTARLARNSILFDHSHHMPELFLKGPYALRLLERLGINTFDA
jgi:hypothetical protein